MCFLYYSSLEANRITTGSWICFIWVKERFFFPSVPKSYIMSWNIKNKKSSLQTVCRQNVLHKVYQTRKILTNLGQNGGTVAISLVLLHRDPGLISDYACYIVYKGKTFLVLD